MSTAPGNHRLSSPDRRADVDAANPVAAAQTARDAQVVVPLGALSVVGPVSDHRLAVPAPEPFSRFRRRVERFKGATDGEPVIADDDTELKLQVLLLREENARLGAARQEPASADTAIEQARMLGSAALDPERADDASSRPAECEVIDEGLDQLCLEVLEAIGSVRGPLAALTERVEPAIEEPRRDVDVTAGHASA